MTVEAELGAIEVVKGLEWWLEEAKKRQDIHYVVIGAVKSGHQMAYDYFGSNGVENIAKRAIKTAEQELTAVLEQRKLGKRNLDLSASYVEWSCDETPMCWDFLIWLIDAEMTRVRLGAPAPLRVAFSKIETLSPKKLSFFENVFRPLLPLVGAVEDNDAIGGRHKPIYVPIEIVQRVRSGEKVPILKATPEASAIMALWLHGAKPVTITLREANHWKSRNSQITEWLKFADELQKKGEDVIFIRDTGKAAWPLPGFNTCPTASFSVDHRMALYEQAKINLGVSNGPLGLALFSETPYLYFVNQQRKDKDYHPHRGDWWLNSNGISPGEQWPWAKPGQQMIWKRDSYRNLCEAWEQHGH